MSIYTACSPVVDPAVGSAAVNVAAAAVAAAAACTVVVNATVASTAAVPTNLVSDPGRTIVSGPVGHTVSSIAVAAPLGYYGIKQKYLSQWTCGKITVCLIHYFTENVFIISHYKGKHAWFCPVKMA